MKTLLPVFKQWINEENWASQVVHCLRIHLPMQETWVRSLGQEDPLEEEVTTHLHILA